MTVSEYFGTLRGKHVVVLGLGVSNLPLMKLLLRFGCTVTGCDKNEWEKLPQEVQELADQGYIDRENLYWEDGVLFSITEKAEPVYFMPEGMAAVTFDAEKWRSGLGAYFFCDCTSFQTAAGHWDGYSVGSEAIS